MQLKMTTSVESEYKEVQIVTLNCLKETSTPFLTAHTDSLPPRWADRS